MVSVFFWLLLVFIFVSITCIIVFGDSPGLRDSPIHKFRLRFLRSLGQFKSYYSRLDTHLNGNLAFYLNCLVPTAYLAIITFCLDQFFTKTFPILVKTPNGPNYLWIVVTISMIYVSTALAVFSDPGDAAKKPDRPNFVNNQLIFFSGNVCSTCDIVKPARSKHCSVCKKCYLLFDHHCLWVNNCVGYYNYRWFLLYLLSNMNFLGYGFYVCFQCLKYEKLVRGGSYWHIIKATTQENEITGIFVILCFLFVIIVVLFTGLHLRYIYLGVTTNEVDKWSEVEHLVNLGVLYRIQNNDIRGEQYLEQASSGNEVVYISLKNQDILLLGSAIQNYNLVQIQSVEHDLVNIYDNGFWNNFRERVFPI